MLALTNRTVTNAADDSAFTRAFTPGASTLALADVTRTGAGWALTQLQGQASDDQLLARLVAVFSGAKPVLFHIHGNNNTPADCFKRSLRLEEIYGVNVVAFSWASEGYLSSGVDDPGVVPDPQAATRSPDTDDITLGNSHVGWVQNKMLRYRRAKENAQSSVNALARALRLLATARLYAHHQPVSLAAHSLGAHFLQYSLPLPGVLESIGALHNLALLAPCVRTAGHTSWLGKLHTKGRVFVTYNQFDVVLAGAQIADGQQGQKLGIAPGDSRLHAPHVRYISFSGANTGWFEWHSYFVCDPGDTLPKPTKQLFSRIFTSHADIQPGEIYRDVYPANCDADGSTCYMQVPPQTDYQPG